MWHVRLQLIDDDGNILGEDNVDVREDLLTGVYQDQNQDTFIHNVGTAATKLYLTTREEGR